MPKQDIPTAKTAQDYTDGEIFITKLLACSKKINTDNGIRFKACISVNKTLTIVWLNNKPSSPVGADVVIEPRLRTKDNKMFYNIM